MFSISIAYNYPVPIKIPSWGFCWSSWQSLHFLRISLSFFFWAFTLWEAFYSLCLLSLTNTCCWAAFTAQHTFLQGCTSQFCAFSDTALQRTQHLGKIFQSWFPFQFCSSWKNLPDYYHSTVSYVRMIWPRQNPFSSSPRPSLRPFGC